MNSPHPDYVVGDPTTFGADEKELAKAHWAGVGVRGFYQHDQPWAHFISERILAHEPQAVFEFGCNVGRNLASLRDRAPSIAVSGIDINPDAIEAGQALGLDVAVGDEQHLGSYDTNQFDVVFTVSVLDHVPEPGPILQALCRVASRAVLLLEPWLGEEGKVLENRSVQSGSMVSTTPYSYSWNYRDLAQEYAASWTLSIEEYPLDTNLGRYYQLYSLTPPAG